MNTLRGWITTMFLLAALTLSVAPANAGIIYGGALDNDHPTCSDSEKNRTADTDLGGIIYGGFTGVIFGFTGIIFGGTLTDGDVENCGIIYGG